MTVFAVFDVTFVEFLSKHEQVAAIKPPKQLTTKRVKNKKPVPCLRLFQAPLRTYNQYYQEVESVKAVADLSFHYDDIQIPWHNPNETINQVFDAQLITLVRNKKFEVNVSKFKLYLPIIYNIAFKTGTLIVVYESMLKK